jgi:23S rRNA (uracil-5-)-methyltransferase RumA
VAAYVTTDIQHCTHFGLCGGCSLLDQPIATQIDSKVARARELLAPYLGDIEPEITLPPRTPRHDRTSILYPIQPKGRTVTLGIYQRGTHVVEEITDCRIQHKALTEFGVRATKIIVRAKITAYDETTGEGVLRAIRARIMPGSHELLIGLIATTSRFVGRDKLMKDLGEAARDLRDDQGRAVKLVGVVLNINETPGNVLLGERTITVQGDPWHHDRVGDLRIQVGFSSFYQLNRHADAVLFKPALKMLGDVKGKTIVDGYGGVGTFTLRMLREGAKHVSLVECSPPACADARANLNRNGFDNAEVLEHAFGTMPLPQCDLMVVDPPRAGLQEIGVRAVIKSGVQRVMLVSCSQESLARDLAMLTPTYRITALRLCDLFPHTEHIETVTILERNA